LNDKPLALARSEATTLGAGARPSASSGAAKRRRWPPRPRRGPAP